MTDREYLDNFDPVAVKQAMRDCAAILDKDEGVQAVRKIARDALAETPTIPAGMVAYGPEHPDFPHQPKDWDGGKVRLRDGSPWPSSINPTIHWGRHDVEAPRQVIAYTPLAAAPKQAEQQGVERLVSDLRGIKGNFERIAAKHPNDQPAYRDGVRPWGTGDLRHVIETLDAALAALNAPTGAVEKERGPDYDPMKHGMTAATEVDRIAILLFEAFAKAEPRNGITQYPASYWATFADLARAVIVDRSTTPSQGLDAATVEQAAISLIVDLCGEGASQSSTNVRVVEDHLRQFARTLATDPHQHGGKGA